MLEKCFFSKIPWTRQRKYEQKKLTPIEPTCSRVRNYEAECKTTTHKRYFRCLCAPGSDHIERIGSSGSWGYFFTGCKPRGKCTLLQTGGLKQAPRRTGAHCVLPLPHTPTPGTLPAGGKKRGVFHRLERREREKSTRRLLTSTTATTQ